MKPINKIIKIISDVKPIYQAIFKEYNDYYKNATMMQKLFGKHYLSLYIILICLIWMLIVEFA